MSSKILIKNIKGLYGAYQKSPSQLKGSELKEFPAIENAFLAIEDSKIIAFGSMEDWDGGITDWSNLEIIDAEGKFVLPAFCDSHTHLVFAASREKEFVYRIEGLSYQEIAAKGGGILNSALRLRETPEEKLYQDALIRAKEIIATGTGAVEIKSGYGLDLDSELKMLRVIKRLKETTDLTIKATFLGAHAFPKDYSREEYLDLVINEMLPVVERESLADFIDVFCEEGYFSQQETQRILDAGLKHGLKPKIHVNQFTNKGGVQLGVKNNAVSVDHLEEMGEEEIALLSKSETVATVLPSCSFFLNIPYAPARKLIDGGATLAIASDFNPGTTPSGNIPFLTSLSCINQKLLPAEALNAVTINGAAAMEVSEELGTIEVGKIANIVMTKELASIAAIPYYFGTNPIETTILKGKIQ